MQKVYLDCNVLLDWALQRQPFADNASILIQLIEQRELIGVVSPLVMANVFYTMRKQHGKAYTVAFLQDCRTHFEFCDNSATALDNAIITPYKDFEDDIHYFSVLDMGIDTIITRNAKDFPPDGKIAIISPDEMLIRLGY